MLGFVTIVSKWVTLQLDVCRKVVVTLRAVMENTWLSFTHLNILHLQAKWLTKFKRWRTMKLTLTTNPMRENVQSTPFKIMRLGPAFLIQAETLVLLHRSGEGARRATRTSSGYICTARQWFWCVTLWWEANQWVGHQLSPSLPNHPGEKGQSKVRLQSSAHHQLDWQWIKPGSTQSLDCWVSEHFRAEHSKR